MDGDRIDRAVKVAADLAAELRSPAAVALSPKAYYDVYLAVASELRLLEMHVSELARRGVSVLTLYERVQETPLVLPRLYLLIAIGSVYVKSGQAEPAEVLRDLVEMCGGVQHPQRGLFLRAYLLTMMKDKLPDAGSAYVGDGGKEGDVAEAEKGVDDSISFVLRNFTEMNRLWVRSQHDVAPREADIERREGERRQLRLLVGSNISTLSRLQGVDLERYRTVVLPAVLDQIVSCHDAIAQEYLADCIAQVFPDDFQLATLDHFLSMCGQLVRGVNIRTILTSVIDRFARYAILSPENAADVRDAEAFEKFRAHLLPVIRRQRGTLAVADRLKIFLALARFSLKSDPENLEHVDDVLGFAVATARDIADGGVGEENDVRTDGGAVAEGVVDNAASHGDAGMLPGECLFSAGEEDLVVRLLTLPLDAKHTMSKALSLTNYGSLQKYLRYRTRRRLAVTLLQSVQLYTPCITKVALLHKLFDYVSCLAEDPPRINDAGEVVSAGSQMSVEDMFDPSALSGHHRYVLSSVPGAVSFMNPTEPSGMSASSPEGGHGMDDWKEKTQEDEGEESEEVDGFGSAGVGDPRDFELGQELISRIVYFCEDRDLGAAFELHIALRERLMCGGKTRIPITLPPLVLASLFLCTSAGLAVSKLSMPNGLDLARRCLLFTVETVDTLRGVAAETALRLYLQISMTAAVVCQQTRTVAAATAGDSTVDDADTVQQYVYETLSRAFEVFETGIVSAESQFTALELLVAALATVAPALENEVYDALSSRTVKHAQRLLTRSDQCLALCACSGLFWTATVPEKVAPVSTQSDENGNGYYDHQHRNVGSVLVCINGALDAARGCVNDGERVMLLLDVAHRVVRLQEMGCGSAAADGRLDEALRMTAEVLTERRAKSSVVGRAAWTRLTRLRKHIKAHPEAFASLALGNV